MTYYIKRLNIQTIYAVTSAQDHDPPAAELRKTHAYLKLHPVPFFARHTCNGTPKPGRCHNCFTVKSMTNLNTITYYFTKDGKSS